jgi:tetratricopeptide (TPR) repeat protein
VNFTVTLDNWYKRIAAILTVTLVAIGLGWVVISNFIIRGVTDRRLALPREWLLAAAERFPNSARINLQLADAEISGGVVAQYDAQAESHATQAVNLSPWNYQARRLLATAQELNGKQEEAENSLRTAVKLAPNHGELNWEFANLLTRRGKLAESFEPYRVAGRSNGELLLSAVETIWRSSAGKIETLKAFAGNDAELSLVVVKFLIEQDLVAEAVSVFNSIDKEARSRSPQSGELITTLMRAGQFGLAKATWLELMAASKAEGTKDAPGRNALVWNALVWNGGFETDAVERLSHFDWAIRENKFARIVIDRNFARTGSRSLKVVFLGIDTTSLKDQVQQTIILNPGANYRLECYAKAKDLVTPEGPRIALFGQGGVIGLSEPVKADSSDWQRLIVDFVAPANSTSATLAIVRTPRFSYDDPTRGIIWFDDFTLVESR